MAVVASVVVLAVSNIRIRHETREKVDALGQAQKNFLDARRQEQLARRRFYAAQTNLAMQAWRAGDVPRALELLEGQRPKPGEEDLRGFEWFYLWRLCYGDRRVPIAGHKAATLSLAFAPDGETLVSGSADGTTRLWNTVTGEPQGILRIWRRNLVGCVFSRREVAGQQRSLAKRDRVGRGHAEADPHAGGVDRLYFLFARQQVPGGRPGHSVRC